MSRFEYICKECSHKLHLLDRDIEVFALPERTSAHCWFCERLKYADDLDVMANPPKEENVQR